MSEVVLFNPPVYYQNGSPRVLDVSYPPLGILYLAAVLKKEQISVKVIDVGAEKQSLNESLELIKKEKPKIIGITAMTPVLQGTVSLAQSIRNNFGNKIKIAIGGSHISTDTNFVKRWPVFDFGVVGEGEITFVKLVENILEGKLVKGIYQGRAVQDLNEIPWPERKLVNLKNYIKRASLIATRGCPFHCYYCSRPAVSDLVRVRNPKNIVDEMEWLYQYCRGDYLFQDDSLTIEKEHTVNLCKEMLSRKKKFHWAAYTRVDLVDEELLEIMGRAGCCSLTFGIESGNDKLRSEVIGKKFNNAQIIKVLKLCWKFGINPDGFFMLGHPGETKKQVEETVNFIFKNKFKIVGVSIPTPFPGSKLWDYAVKDKVVNKKFIDRFATGELGLGYAGVYPVYCPKTLSLEWLYQCRRKIMRGFYLRPGYILNRIISDLFSPYRLKTDIVEGINVFLRGSSARSPYQKKIK